MTHTIEDINRLVPEAIPVPNSFTSNIYKLFGRIVSPYHDEVFQALLTARAQLEAAMEALEITRNLIESDAPGFALNRIDEALAKIGEMK